MHTNLELMNQIQLVRDWLAANPEACHEIATYTVLGLCTPHYEEDPMGIDPEVSVNGGDYIDHINIALTRTGCADELRRISELPTVLDIVTPEISISDFKWDEEAEFYEAEWLGDRLAVEAALEAAGLESIEVCDRPSATFVAEGILHAKPKKKPKDD